MPLTPEQLARQQIDGLLDAAGWMLQDRGEFNRNAALGVTVREFPLPNGPCDYMLIVDGKAAGVIEAKKAGTTLSGVADQSERHMAVLPEHLARWGDRLCFGYESNGDETHFRDMRDPKPRSRRVFAFHRPETPHQWLLAGETLRYRLQHMPALEQSALRACQILFFDKHTPRADKKPNARALWICDFRTNQHFTLKKNPLKADDLESSLRATQPRIEPSVSRRNGPSASKSTNYWHATRPISTSYG